VLNQNNLQSGARTNGVVESPQILNGWKEIASFMGRGVRTVQRWEAIGLPVRRPHGRMRSAVVASAKELTAWLAATPLHETDVEKLQARIAQLEAENAALRQQLALTMRVSSDGHTIIVKAS
jgi:phage terminase Nu1 subunit (DNA packaging protein)